MTEPNDVSGAAALTICDSLLLALKERGILPEAEIIGILMDAAAVHENVPDDDPEAELHQAASTLINGILAGGNSARRN